MKFLRYKFHMDVHMAHIDLGQDCLDRNNKKAHMWDKAYNYWFNILCMEKHKGNKCVHSSLLNFQGHILDIVIHWNNMQHNWHQGKVHNYQQFHLLDRFQERKLNSCFQLDRYYKEVYIARKSSAHRQEYWRQTHCDTPNKCIHSWGYKSHTLCAHLNIEHMLFPITSIQKYKSDSGCDLLCKSNKDEYNSNNMRYKAISLFQHTLDSDM